MATSSKSRSQCADTSMKYSKMHIPAFPAALDERHMSNLDDELREAILAILRKSNNCLRFEELYRNAYTMVLQKNGEKLYNGTQSVVTDHAMIVREDVIKNLNNKFLFVLNNYWKDHQASMILIRDILMYLDKVYVSQNNLINVYDMGLIVFRDTILRYPPIKNHLQQTLLDMVQRERKGEVTSRSQIRDITQMLTQLGVGSLQVYQEDFEEMFLEQSRVFYRKESETFLIESNSVNLYIQKAEQRIEEETKQARHYLDPSTEKKIVLIMEEEWISRHLHAIVNMENCCLVRMFEQRKMDCIARMYKLLARVSDGLKVMSTCLSDYLRQKGKLSVEDTNKSPIDFIKELLVLREHFDELEDKALGHDRLFHAKINQDFEYIINLHPRSPEYLSLFIDDKLKRVPEPDQDIEALFDKCTVLFRYLAERDIFESFYRQYLTKRLLLSRSQSDHNEKLMVSKLKNECGGQFTSKLEGMFRDMAVSQLLMEEYQGILNPVCDADSSQPPLQTRVFPLDVRVLTSARWPTQPPTQVINLPEEAANAFQSFERYYLSKHSGRCLTLQSNFGGGEILATFCPSGYAATKEGSPPQSTGTNDQPNTPVVAGSSASSPERLSSRTRLSSHSSTQSAISTTLQTRNSALSQIGDAAQTCSAGGSTKTAEVRKHILQVSTYQMCVLMLFNKADRYTLEEIGQLTNLPQAELMRCLHSLAMARSGQRVLMKEPKTKKMLMTDVFMVNEGFTSRHYKIKVQNMALKETEPEHRETRTLVDENRKYIIETTIVRVMKSFRSMLHSQLIAEVTQNLMPRFVPSTPMIKGRIESLIEREYLSRSEDRKTYQYIA